MVCLIWKKVWELRELVERVELNCSNGIRKSTTRRVNGEVDRLTWPVRRNSVDVYRLPKHSEDEIGRRYRNCAAAFFEEAWNLRICRLKSEYLRVGSAAWEDSVVTPCGEGERSSTFDIQDRK